MHKFYALAVTHWKHVTSERGFDDANSGREGKPDTEKPKGQLPSYHLTTTANRYERSHTRKVNLCIIQVLHAAGRAVSFHSASKRTGCLVGNGLLGIRMVAVCNRP